MKRLIYKAGMHPATLAALLGIGMALPGVGMAAGLPYGPQMLKAPRRVAEQSLVGLMSRGQQSQKSGQFGDAVSAYKQVLELNPRYPLALYELSQCYQLMGNLEAADAMLNRLMAVNPTLAGVYLQRGKLAKELNQPALAKTMFEQGLERFPDHPLLWFHYGLLLDDGGDVAGAIKAYERSLSLDPKNPAAHNNLGLLVQISEPEKAMMYFRQALTYTPGYSLAALNLGHLLANHGHMAEAAQLFDKVEQQAPKEPLLYIYRGALKFKMQAFESALADYESARQLQPQNAVIYYLMALTAIELSNWPAALSSAQLVLELDPDCPQAAHARRLVQVLTMRVDNTTP